jgi:DNA-binding MarR family transcriptional regulator
MESKAMTKAKVDKLRLGAFLSLIRFNDVATRYTAIEFMRHGSSSMRMMLMNALFLNGGSMSPTELSRRIFRTRHSITSMVDTLERQGLVRREANLKDRRSINVTLTPEGKRLFERMVPVGYEISQKALSCLDDDEVVVLKTLLRRVREHLLEQIANPPIGQD